MEHAFAQAAVRFGYGTGPRDTAAGSPGAWLKDQLRGPDPGLASGRFDRLPTGRDAMDAIRADQFERKALPEAARRAYKPIALEMLRQDIAAQLDWTLATPAPFRERLVWFWANHFSVSAVGLPGALVGPMVREAIRPHVTGRFADMVLAAERHPAMLIYLANAQSVGPNSPVGLRTQRGLNENLGRECMELHTVSLAAGYTQTDVTSMAKVLTGWSIAGSEGGSDATGFKFRPATHEPGPQRVMGRDYDGGEQAGIAALRDFATYPTTYRAIATKLVTHFVADAPPPHAIAHIAGVLHDTKGDLGAAAAALVDLPEAWAPGHKFKTPFDYAVSVLRAAPAPAPQPRPNLREVSNALGQPFWIAPLPNGWPDTAAPWSGSDALMARIDWAYTYAGRFDAGRAGPQPADIANAALGKLLRPATYHAMAQAGSRREALTLLFTSPEFQRR
ncbi:MAG: hypothetical protein B7Z81_01620 [Acidocella sp. 20-61-6]|nr:MAG: hypothetical protein B7Z81_01620 [Acidocella sp. 20-61-6]